MANKIAKQEPAIDKIYIPALITLAKGKYCNLCGNYITEDEAEHKDFAWSKTKRGNDVFVHMHCLKEI